MSNEHVERRAGQRWQLTTALYGVRIGTLRKRSPCGTGWSCAEGESGFHDSAWTDPKCTMTLLSDAPSPRLEGSSDGRSWSDCTGGSCGHVMHREATGAVTPPAGYVICKMGCGRWTDPGLGVHQCWTCLNMADRPEAVQFPDWTPPLESKPAETGKCPHGKQYHCADCDIARAIAAQRAAQEAPKAKHCCAVSEGGYACACHSLKPAVDLKAAWMAAQSGTPYAGPERLERPKLAHSMGVEDPALEDA